MLQEISDQEIKQISHKINRSLIKKLKPSSKPTAILVGGQPAAGKTGLISTIKQKESQHDFIEINGDDLRSWHPHYWALLKQNDALAADHTQKAVNFWVESLINAAIKHRRNIIIEGTLRKPNVPLSTAALLKKNGYQVGLYVMAIPFWQSELRIFERYERQKEQMAYGRFSNLAIHKQAFDSFIGTLEVVLAAGNIDFIKAFGRDMNGLKLLCGIDALESQPEWGNILRLMEIERGQLITRIESAEYEKVWCSVLQKMDKRGATKDEIAQVLAVREKSIERFSG